MPGGVRVEKIVINDSNIVHGLQIGQAIQLFGNIDAQLFRIKIFGFGRFKYPAGGIKTVCSGFAGLGAAGNQKKQKKIMKTRLKEKEIIYNKDIFIKDLKKVCRPVKKNDKHKPSSGKT